MEGAVATLFLMGRGPPCFEAAFFYILKLSPTILSEAKSALFWQKPRPQLLLQQASKQEQGKKSFHSNL